MKIPTNKYLIEVESTVNDTFTTENGTKFYRDLTLDNTEWYKKTEGTVLAVPEKFSDTPTRPTRCTVRRFGKRKVIGHGAMQKCVKAGDKVWFNYLALTERSKFFTDGMKADTLQYLIYGDDIQAYERDGNLYANTGRCILSPVEEEVKMKTKLIIPRSYRVKKSMSMAKVLAVGKPFKGYNKSGIKKGDVVVYNKEEGDWLDENQTMLSVYHTSIHLIVRP